jgi:MtN3 and saliva related transmembrane protein
MSIPLFFAICAPLSTMVQFIPQVYKMHKTKKVKDISEFAILFWIFSAILWLVHGIFIDDLSISISSIINILVCLFMLLLYYKYR